MEDLVDVILYAEEKARRGEALKTIIALPDKDQVEKYILERLASETDRWQRTWSLSALAGIALADGKKMVLDYTVDPPESDPWARHFALVNAANFDPFPTTQIEWATKDVHVLPKATAFRLLLANGQDRYKDELLKMLRDANDPNAHWAAAWALRNRSPSAARGVRRRG